MTTISVGILYAAIDLLKLLDRIPGIDQRFPEIFTCFSVASPKLTLDLAQRCGWVRFHVNGYLEITGRGRTLLGFDKSEAVLRLQLDDVIETYSPNWAPLLSRGRAESFKYLPLDVQQCFLEAGLLNPIDDEIVIWWDKLAQLARKSLSDNKLEVGRIGERLSIEHERKRTKSEPIWQAIESNLCGYDILSVRDTDSNERLLIEVKTSNSRPSVASFYLSRLEWRVAQISDNFVFHLWALSPEPELFVVNKDQIANHIPQNIGQGEWERVLIPFETLIN